MVLTDVDLLLSIIEDLGANLMDCITGDGTHGLTCAHHYLQWFVFTTLTFCAVGLKNEGFFL